MGTVVARKFTVKSCSENLVKFSEKPLHRSPFLINSEATDLLFYLTSGLAQVILSNMARIFGTVFFQLTYLKSDFINSPQRGSKFSLACNLGLLLGLGQVPLNVRWIPGGRTICPLIKRLLSTTGIKPTSFRNSTSIVADLEVYSTTPRYTPYTAPAKTHNG